MNKHRKNLLALLRTQADVACDSHNVGTLERMFVNLIKLLRLDVNRDRRKEFVRILNASAAGDGVVLALDGDELYIHGTIRLKELSKRVVWGRGIETMDGGSDAE
jgi:hypothetical protein